MLAIAVEFTGEATMKRVALLPLLLVFAGCVTYEGIDQDGRHAKYRTLIECRQSGAVACRMLEQNSKGKAMDDGTYMTIPRY